MGRGIRITLATCTVAVALAAGGGAPARAAGFMEGDWIQNTGDLMQIALPVIGGGATFFTNPDPDKLWDRQGTKQFAYSYGSAWGTTYLLKYVVAKARPNGNNRTSFPSGHTMSAFAGAGFIDGRYGRAWGIPALALAAFTGYSRVHSEWHYADDVLAGASIGLLYNWQFVTPQRGKVQLLPTVNSNGYGIQVTVKGGDDDTPEDTSPRGASYDFVFGPAFLIANEVSAAGSPFNLGDLEGNNDPTTTAVVNVGFPVGRRSDVRVSWGPFEARDDGAFGQDIVFGDLAVPAGTPVSSAWRFYDLRGEYDYALVGSPRWDVHVGGGLGLSYSYVALELQDQSASEKLTEDVIYPYALFAATYRFARRWSLGVGANGVAIGNNWILDAGAEIVYRAGRAWDFQLGYRYFSRKLESDTMLNKVRYNVPFAGVARYW